VSKLPAAPRLPATVKRRETTTLVTVDGTVLHRDRFVLATARGAASAFEVTLPPGAVLWSARVGEQAVRPLQRTGARTSTSGSSSGAAAGATIAIPLGFAGGAETTVEVIAVLARTIPPGRSRLELTAAEVAVPVLDHRWRLLLPENARYRFAAGDLRPVTSEVRRSGVTVAATEIEKIPTARDPYAVLQSTPGAVTDRINVGGDEETATPAVHGPGGNASIFGRAVDEQGAPLPGVTLTIASGSVSAPIVQISNGQGFFHIVALPGGRYSLKAELEGFSTIEYPNIELGGAQSTRIEVTMSSAVEDVITVTSEAPLLDERRLSPGTTVSLDEGRGGAYYDFDAYTEARKGRRGAASARNAADYAAGAHDLMQGLIGGVKPLDVAIPESGKALLLAGVLPPSRVTVELEVKGAK